MRIITLGGVAAASVLLSACATVTRGTSQSFRIQSTPSEAQVALSTGQQCVTPCQMKLKRKPGFTATIKKQGYQTQTVEVHSKLGGGGAVAGAGNILIGGVIGGLVDGSNGSLNNLTPNPLEVTLVPEQPATTASAPSATAPAEAPVVLSVTPGEAPVPAEPTTATPAASTPAPGGE